MEIVHADRRRIGFVRLWCRQTRHMRVVYSSITVKLYLSSGKLCYSTWEDPSLKLYLSPAEVGNWQGHISQLLQTQWTTLLGLYMICEMMDLKMWIRTNIYISHRAAHLPLRNSIFKDAQPLNTFIKCGCIYCLHFFEVSFCIQYV